MAVRLFFDDNFSRVRDRFRVRVAIPVHIAVSLPYTDIPIYPYTHIPKSSGRCHSLTLSHSPLSPLSYGGIANDPPNFTVSADWMLGRLLATPAKANAGVRIPHVLQYPSGSSLPGKEKGSFSYGND